MSRWIDEVEAAVDSYGDTWARSEHEATDNAEAVALRYRAALLDLVTNGRCPECGRSWSDANGYAYQAAEYVEVLLTCACGNETEVGADDAVAWGVPGGSHA